MLFFTFSISCPSLIYLIFSSEITFSIRFLDPDLNDDSFQTLSFYVIYYVEFSIQTDLVSLFFSSCSGEENCVYWDEKVSKKKDAFSS